MENKRIHYILIPILVIALAIYSYKRINKNEEIDAKPKSEISDSKNKDIEIKSKVEFLDSDSPVQIGNCYSYEKEGNYYGVVVIKYEDDDLFTVSLLEEVKKQELKISDFENGNLMCVKSELMKGYPVNGLWTGFFLKEDLKVFKTNFKYVGNIKLIESEIEINGGGSLISSSEVNIKDLHYPKMLKEMSRYKSLTANYIGE